MERDIYRTDLVYEREKQKINALPTSEKNLCLISDFLRRMEVEGKSLVQLVKYSYTLRQFCMNYHGELIQSQTKDIENYLLSLHDCGEKTRNVRFYCLRVFFNYIGKIAIFQGLKISDRWRYKLPEDILTPAEVESIIAHGYKHARFLAILYESGCRIGEILTARQDNVSFDENGATMQINGKTGGRRIRIIRYAELLREQVKQANGLVFPYAYPTVRIAIQRAAKRAGIEKPVHPHLFRHSRATHLAKALTEQELKIFFGWSGASKMAATYVHLSGADIDKKLIEIQEREDYHRNKLLQKTITCNESDAADMLKNSDFRIFLSEQWQKFQQQAKS